MHPAGHFGEWEWERQPQPALVRLQWLIMPALTAMSLLYPSLCGHVDIPQPLMFVRQLV